mgnify:CR=1 FL=1
MDDPIQACRFRIRGRVQGVGFRHATREQARAIGVRGWVRNESDGSVVAVAAGTADQLETFRRWCTEGPARARVTDVDVAAAAEPDSLPEPFEVRG